MIPLAPSASPEVIMNPEVTPERCIAYRGEVLAVIITGVEKEERRTSPRLMCLSRQGNFYPIADRNYSGKE